MQDRRAVTREQGGIGRADDGQQAVVHLHPAGLGERQYGPCSRRHGPSHDGLVERVGMVENGEAREKSQRRPTIQCLALGRSGWASSGRFGPGGQRRSPSID